MQPVSRIAAVAGGSGPAARTALRALAAALAGADPAVGWRWSSPWQRRAVTAAAVTAIMLLCAASLLAISFGDLKPSRATAVALKRAGRGLPSCGAVPGHVVRQCLPPDWLALIPGGLATVAVLAALLPTVVPLVLAGRHPLAGWRAGWLGLALAPLLGIPWQGGLPWNPVQLLVLLGVLAGAGIRDPRPVLCWLAALTLAPWWFWIIRDGPDLVTAALGTIATGGLAAAADSAGSRRRARLALASQAERTEVEQARRAVLEERARIARELHDVVAHHMSLIAVRAETAPYRLAALPAPARAEFGSLSGAAREAMADMRRLLGVLRSDQPAALAPQPGLPDMPALIDDARQAGMTVTLSAPAPPVPGQVPSSVGVCGYRIVQEALSNAARHAPGAEVTLSVSQQPEMLALRIANGPATPASDRPDRHQANGHQANRHRANGHRPGPEHGTGHGLAGMRERVELLGGTLSAGPAPGGGFVVSAALPLGGPPP